jgi:hypothetical protein
MRRFVFSKAAGESKPEEKRMKLVDFFSILFGPQKMKRKDSL